MADRVTVEQVRSGDRVLLSGLDELREPWHVVAVVTPSHDDGIRVLYARTRPGHALSRFRMATSDTVERT